MIERLLRSRYATRILFAALLAVVVFAVGVRFYVLPAFATPASPGPYAEIWANLISYVTDAGLQATFATIILAVLFLSLVPEEVRLGKIETVSPNDIREALLSEIPGAEEYYFRGRSARWFRSNVLPGILKQAKLSSRTKRLYLLLPNPHSSTLMRDYADYRNSISYPGKTTIWTSWDIEKEILATLVAVAHANNNSVLIVPEVGMLDSYSLMRIDMVAETATLTREDPKLPAIRCYRGSTLFDSMREEIVQGISQGASLPLPIPGARGRPLDDSFVLDVLAAINLTSIAGDPAKVTEILEAVLHPEDPYK